ncbi:MAG: hypothetical protein ACTSSJ_03365 [Candidatus Odinarchaeia archaeon]
MDDTDEPVIEATIKEVVKNPEKFLGKKVKVKGVIHLLGVEEGADFTVNIPLEEDLYIGFVKSGKYEILFKAARDLPIPERNLKETTLRALVEKKGETVFLRLIKCESE